MASRMWRVAFLIAILGSAAAPGQQLRPVTAAAVPLLVVDGVEPFAPFGKSVDWSPSGELVATAKRGADGFYDVVFVSEDGTIALELTRRRWGCPQKHNGNPAWHPSGELLVFTAENRDVMGLDAHRIAIPGRGVNCNLWLARADGSQFWRLTHHPTSYFEPQAVIHPQISPDGSRLLWAERVRNKLGTWWGEWSLKVARLVLDDGAPRLEDAETLQPGERGAFYEAHDWSADGAHFLFSGNLRAGQPELGMDIYRFDIASGRIERLTSSLFDWDEHAHWSPDGRLIAWMSSRGFEIDWSQATSQTWGEYLVSELWAMRANGSGAQRLTYFNEPGHPHHVPGSEACVVSDSEWSPDGQRIVLNLYCRMTSGARTARLVLLQLSPRRGAPPGVGAGPPGRGGPAE